MVFEFEETEDVSQRDAEPGEPCITLEYYVRFKKCLPLSSYPPDWTPQQIVEYETQQTSENTGETVEWGLSNNNDVEVKVEHLADSKHLSEYIPGN